MSHAFVRASVRERSASPTVFEWLPTLAYARSYGAANVLNQVASEGGVPIVFNADANMTSDGHDASGKTPTLSISQTLSRIALMPISRTGREQAG